MGYATSQSMELTTVCYFPIYRAQQTTRTPSLTWSFEVGLLFFSYRSLIWPSRFFRWLQNVSSSIFVPSRRSLTPLELHPLGSAHSRPRTSHQAQGKGW